MKHLVLNSTWFWDQASHAFKCAIDLGEHLRDEAGLKVPTGLEPIEGVTVWRGGKGNQLLYAGCDLAKAETIWREADPEFWVHDIERVQVLPQGKFGVADGKLTVVDEDSEGILLFVGHYAIRGDAEVVTEETDAQILCEACAGRQERRLELAAVIQPGQKLVVYVSGRGAVKGLITYRNEGGRLVKIVE